MYMICSEIDHNLQPHNSPITAPGKIAYPDISTGKNGHKNHLDYYERSERI